MDIPKPVSSTSIRFMDRLTVFIRSRGLAYRTEKTYCLWVRRFIRFHGYSHPEQLRPDDIEPFLTHLSVERTTSVNTQRTALNALVFLFREFLQHDIGQLTFSRACKPRKLPTVLSRDEALLIIGHLKGLHRLVAQLMYGSGLRIMEAVRLRVKDLDFANGSLWVQEAKGGKARRTLLPTRLISVLKEQVACVANLHASDLETGHGSVYLPDALARKYPNAPYELSWQYVFPAYKYSIDPRSGVERRHHIGEQQIQRAVKAATRHAGVNGHSSIETTQIYTHVVGLHERGMVSPVDIA